MTEEEILKLRVRRAWKESEEKREWKWYKYNSSTWPFKKNKGRKIRDLLIWFAIFFFALHVCELQISLSFTFGYLRAVWFVDKMKVFTFLWRIFLLAVSVLCMNCLLFWYADFSFAVCYLIVWNSQKQNKMCNLKGSNFRRFSKEIEIK